LKWPVLDAKKIFIFLFFKIWVLKKENDYVILEETKLLKYTINKLKEKRDGFRLCVCVYVAKIKKNNKTLLFFVII